MPLRGGDLARQAEIQDLHAAVGADEDVLRLQIAMRDALLVRRGQAERDLRGDLDRFARRHRLTGEPLTQRLADEQFQHRVGDALLHAEIVNGEDVRVRERRDGFGLALESIARRPDRSRGAAAGP